MKIKTNLILLSAIFVISMAALWCIVFYTFGHMSKEIQEGVVVGQLTKDVSDLNILTCEYILHYEERIKQQWRGKYDSLGKLSNRAFKICLHPGVCCPIYDAIKEDYKALGGLFSQLEENSTKIKKLKEQNRSAEEIDLGVILGERLTAQILMRSQKITQASFKLSNLITQGINQTQANANLIILFSIIGFTIFSIFVSFVTAKAIIGPINDLIKGTQIIARGDLEYKIICKSKNELGKLAASFNQMTQDLKLSRDKIEEYGKELENKVSERTKDLEKVYLSLKKRSEELQGAKANLEEKAKLIEAAKAGLEERIKERTKELEEKVEELEMFNKLVVDRELKMVELKNEIVELKARIEKAGGK